MFSVPLAIAIIVALDLPWWEIYKSERAGCLSLLVGALMSGSLIALSNALLGPLITLIALSSLAILLLRRLR